MTKALYTAVSEYVEEINALPVKHRVSVSGLLKKSGVSRSGCHAWKKRVPSDTEIHRAVLKEKIRKIYNASHQNLKNIFDEDMCSNWVFNEIFGIVFSSA